MLAAGSGADVICTSHSSRSVVVAPIRDGFTLQKLGCPEEAATMFLQNTGGWVLSGCMLLPQVVADAGMPNHTLLHPPAPSCARSLSTPATHPPARPPPAVAPEGSGKTAVLLGAGSRRDAAGELYYWQEFTVRSDRFFRHNLSGEPACTPSARVAG